MKGSLLYRVKRTMSVKSVVVSLFLGMLIFVLGGAVGIFYQKQKTTIQPQDSAQAVPQVVRDLSSKVIPSTAAYGTVAKIDGSNLTVSSQGDSVIIKMRNDANIYSSQDPKIPSQPIDFKSLKIGDNVGIGIKVLSNGQMEGFSVIILPPISNSGAK